MRPTFFTVEADHVSRLPGSNRRQPAVGPPGGIEEAALAESELGEVTETVRRLITMLCSANSMRSADHFRSRRQLSIVTSASGVAHQRDVDPPRRW
jgi:hypothetical protein